MQPGSYKPQRAPRHVQSAAVWRGAVQVRRAHTAMLVAEQEGPVVFGEGNAAVMRRAAAQKRAWQSPMRRAKRPPFRAGARARNVHAVPAQVRAACEAAAAKLRLCPHATVPVEGGVGVEGSPAPCSRGKGVGRGRQVGKCACVGKGGVSGSMNTETATPGF